MQEDDVHDRNWTSGRVLQVIVEQTEGNRGHHLTLSSTFNWDDRTIISDPKLLEAKLGRISRDGLENLQVISDFDYTISRFRNGLEKLQCTHEAIEMHPGLDRTVIEKLRSLREYYIPLETSSFMNRVQLKKAMLTWWEQSHGILTSASITKQMITDVQNVGKIALRDRFDEFVNHLRQQKIPLTIFSAGLGDVIELMLKNANLLHELIYVVSNFLEFDAEDKAIGFKKPTIHSQNKTLATVSKSKNEFSNILPKLNRPNIILLGDTKQDVHMIRGHSSMNNCSNAVILRIGWLNQPTEEKIREYKDIYDIVLIQQETFNIPCQILHWIFANSSPQTVSSSSNSDNSVHIEE